MAANDGGQYVTKSQALLWIGSSISLLTMMMWVVLMNHASMPHARAVDKEVFEHVLMTQAEWRDEQRRDTAEIKESLSELRRSLQTWKEAP